jgi:hypothetical protein
MVSLMSEIGFGSRYVVLFAIAVAEMPGVSGIKPAEIFADGATCPISITLAYVDGYYHGSVFGTGSLNPS